MLDLQVNGYAGVDFNADGTTVEEIRAACAALREDGVDAVLATVITAELEVMERRLAKLAAARRADPLVGEVIAGLHVEGPFISAEPGFVGAHPAEATRDADPGAADRLLEAGDGLVRLVTLAPERDPGFATTRFLAGRGIVVSCGHADPSLATLEAAIDAGLTMITHLGNGCPATLPRHDNIVQRALSLADRLWIGFIPDGVHVPWFALRNYLEVAGLDRAFFVSDAISAARLGPGTYTLGHWTLAIGEDLVARAPDGSHLVGSTVTLPRMKAEAAPALGLGEDELRRLVDTNPRRALGASAGTVGTPAP